jgi:hypothetical protein
MTIVIGTIPPTSLERAIAIGVVRDLGRDDLIIERSNPNALPISTHEVIDVITPTKIPPKIGMRCSFNRWIFLYNGIAKTTVAGARKKAIRSPPFL